MRKNGFYNSLAVLVSLVVALGFLLLELFGMVGLDLTGAYIGFGLSILTYVNLLVLSIYSSTGRSLGLVSALREQRLCLTISVPGTFVTSLLRILLVGLPYTVSRALMFVHTAFFTHFIIAFTALVFGVLNSFCSRNADD